MSTQKELNALRVLVTRPKPQGKILCEQIGARGGEAIFFPTVNIMPSENQALFKENLAHLDQFDWVIFTSPQAVSHTLPIISPASKVKIAAVGGGTAKLLSEHFSVIFPAEEWNSEGLLDMPEFHNVADKKIAIIKGAGGRTLLRDELMARGAEVIPIIAYQRVLPTEKNSDGLHDLDIDVIICTSNEGLRNLKILLEKDWPTLQNRKILVISPRMVAHAHELGFKDVLLARNASHEALIEALVALREKLYG